MVRVVGAKQVIICRLFRTFMPCPLTLRYCSGRWCSSNSRPGYGSLLAKLLLDGSLFQLARQVQGRGDHLLQTLPSALSSAQFPPPLRPRQLSGLPAPELPIEEAQVVLLGGVGTGHVPDGVVVEGRGLGTGLLQTSRIALRCFQYAVAVGSDEREACDGLLPSDERCCCIPFRFSCKPFSIV